MTVHSPIPANIGSLGRTGRIGAMFLIGGGSDCRAVRNLHWDILRHGIRKTLEQWAIRCELAGVQQAEIHNPGGTDGSMSFAQMAVIEHDLAGLHPIREYALAMAEWRRRLGWLPTVYVGKCEDEQGTDAQLEKAGWSYAVDTILQAFPDCPVCIDHSSRYRNGSLTYKTIDRLCMVGIPTSVEPRPPFDSDARNDMRVGSFTMADVFERSLHEAWPCPLDEAQNTVHSVLCHHGNTPIATVRKWLGWGLDVYVPIDAEGKYLGVKAGEITA